MYYINFSKILMEVGRFQGQARPKTWRMSSMLNRLTFMGVNPFGGGLIIIFGKIISYCWGRYRQRQLMQFLLNIDPAPRNNEVAYNNISL